MWANKCMEFVRCARPTRKGDASLLVSHAPVVATQSNGIYPKRQWNVEAHRGKRSVKFQTDWSSTLACYADPPKTLVHPRPAQTG